MYLYLSLSLSIYIYIYIYTYIHKRVRQAAARPIRKVRLVEGQRGRDARSKGDPNECLFRNYWY